MERDDNVQQQIEQEMEQAFLEEIKARVQEDIDTVKQEMRENDERVSGIC